MCLFLNYAFFLPLPVTKGSGLLIHLLIWREGLVPNVLTGYMMGFHQETKEILHFEVRFLAQYSILTRTGISYILPFNGIALYYVPFLGICISY